MAKLTLDDVQNIYGNSLGAEANINSNSAAIEEALENTLSRDGTQPNNMQADLDMDGNRITNLLDGVAASDAATVGQISELAAPSYAITDLNDVVISAAVVGEMLLYDGANWRNQPTSVIGAVNVLNDLQDVVISNPTDQQAVIYNGAEARWENTTIPSGVTDHGLLTGLFDDDHPQYLTVARGNTYYALGSTSVIGTGTLTGGGTLFANRTITLENDLVSPGTNRYYGTGPAGTKGWFALPSQQSDHGGLSGLADDDHPHYFNQTRGDARYALVGHTHSSYANKSINETITATWTFSAVPQVSGGGAVLYHGNAANTSGKITVSASAPSGGSNGDIWFVIA